MRKHLVKWVLKPAEVQKIEILERVIQVYVEDKYKALAIGKWASNVKLASIIIGKRIEIL